MCRKAALVILSRDCVPFGFLLLGCLLSGAECVVGASAQLENVCQVEQNTRVLVYVVRGRRDPESVLGQGFGRLDLASSYEKPCSDSLQRDPRGDVGTPDVRAPFRETRGLVILALLDEGPG